MRVRKDSAKSINGKHLFESASKIIAATAVIGCNVRTRMTSSDASNKTAQK
ncbi:MAG TPA: hypothetical protein VEG44_10215 [Candidatus Acidoferrales bacterium]|nr:hypothetical protein [Candidatus Acidoferrales bacterium]